MAHTFAPQIERWRSLVAQYFPSDQVDLALAIINRETGGSGDPTSHNTSGEDSRGLFQINVGPGANTDLAGMNLFDPSQNVQAAKIVFDRAGGWSPWTTYPLALADLGQLVAPGMPQPGQPSGPAVATIPQATAQPVPSVTGTLGSIADGLNNLLRTVTNIPTSIWNSSTAWLGSTAALLGFFGQEHVWERIGLVLLGGLLVVVGLVLFALSFLPRGSAPVPVPV